MKKTINELVRDGVIAHQQVWQRRSNELLAEAFGSWLGIVQKENTAQQQLAKRICSATGAQRTYRSVAASAFLVAADGCEPMAEEYFRAGMAWLTKRQPRFDGTPMGISVDGTAILGIALATMKNGSDGDKNVCKGFFSSFVGDSLRSAGLPGWQRFLMDTAGRLLGVETPSQEFGANEADVILLSASRTLRKFSEDEQDAAGLSFLEMIRNGPVDGLEIDRVALRLSVYEWLLSQKTAVTIRGAGVEDVARILKALDRSFYRWTWEEKPRTSRKGVQARKWHIENEYHLQNFLWTVLAPLFPDLKEEEFTDSLGQLQPRTDLVIPSLRLIVEAKFMYDSTTPTEIIEQIAADVSLYLKRGSVYSSVIPVIWDNGARVEEHHKMLTGIKDLNGVYDAVVICRPAMMNA
jgi:hypothetical protein